MIFNRTKTLEDYIKGTIDYNKLIECLLYNDNLCKDYLFKPDEIRIIYNFIVLPIIFILLITLTINSTISYNEVINKHLILQPLIIYKTEIANVNNNFTNILHNDKFVYKEQKSVDRNIANTILLVLYNEIFSDMLLLITSTSDTYSSQTPLYLEEMKKNKDKYKINILPKFKYILNNKKEILDYNKLDEYNINNYVTNHRGDDIFESKKFVRMNERIVLYYFI